MKATSKLILSAVAAALGAIGVHGAAMAETTESGVICKPAGYSNAPGLHATNRGVENRTTANMNVLCPIVRTREPASAYFKVTVDVFGASATTTCTLFSYGPPDAGWRGQMTQTVPAGYQAVHLELPRERVPLGSYQTVQCKLAPKSWLFAVRPQQ